MYENWNEINDQINIHNNDYKRINDKTNEIIQYLIEQEKIEKEKEEERKKLDIEEGNKMLIKMLCAGVVLLSVEIVLFYWAVGMMCHDYTLYE